jgi:hypothetical protein
MCIFPIRITRSAPIYASNLISQQVLQNRSPFHHARTRILHFPTRGNWLNLHLLHWPEFFHWSHILLASWLSRWRIITHNVLPVSTSNSWTGQEVSLCAPLRRRRAHIQDTCMGGVHSCRQWEDPSMPTHKVQELHEQWLTLQRLPRSEDDRFAPRAGKKTFILLQSLTRSQT